MASQPDRRFPPDSQPYDVATGVRVGAFVGALVGAGLAGLAGSGFAWAIVPLAVVGGAVGYVSERRRLQRWREGGSR